MASIRIGEDHLPGFGAIQEAWGILISILGGCYLQAFLMLLRHGGGGAAAFQTNRGCFGKEIFDSNILLLFYKIK